MTAIYQKSLRSNIFYIKFLQGIFGLMANKPIIDDLTRSEEYVKVIQQIVDVIAHEDMRIQLKIRELKAMPNSLDKLAALAEYKILARQVNDLRKKARKIISRSTNKIVIAMLLPESN